MSETSYKLTLTEVSQCVRLSVDTLVTIVDHGIVAPRGARPEEWLFEPQMLQDLQRACRLQHDLELDWQAVALALELLDEVERLRRDNERLRRQLAGLMDVEMGA